MNAIPTVTKNLLIINVLVFLATIVAQSYHLDLARYLGLHFFLADDFNAAQLITYMFMHGGFTHLFFNMFAVDVWSHTRTSMGTQTFFILLYDMWYRCRLNQHAGNLHTHSGCKDRNESGND